MRAALSAALLVAAAGLHADSRAQGPGGWGLQSGRADGSDVAQLWLAMGRLLLAERVLNLVTEGNTHIFNLERQNELLGRIDPELLSAHGQFAKMSDWWAHNVLQPALDIASNPAASCGLARNMAERVGKVVSQAQVFGLADVIYGASGNSVAILQEVALRVRRRCLEDSFDECMLTGNAGAVAATFAATSRQSDFLGLEGDGWADRVVYVMRRCAVYKLNYRMSLRNEVMGATSEWEGSFILLFQTPAEGEAIYRIVYGYWQAPDPGDTTPPDILLLNVDCRPPLSACDRMPAEGTGGVIAHVRLSRTVVDQIPHIVLTDPFERGHGGNVDPRTTTRREGEDRLELYFGPPVVHLHARERGRLLVHMPPVGTDWYYEATRDLEIGEHLYPPVSDWVREGYSILFKAASGERPAVPPWNASERTVFELVHRPDLFPPHELNPEFEVTETQAPPRRLPARDGSGSVPR